MKNLYRYIAPFLSDTFGFQEIVDVTDSMGILDDCTPYKGRVSRTDIDEPYLGSHMVTTWLSRDDVISGTKKAIMAAFRKQRYNFDPAFVMIATSPVSSMIGTDMQDVANAITQESSLPTTSVDLGGHKYYDHGVSETLLSMAKLLVRPAQMVPGTMNLIGGNAIDWTAENVRACRAWAQENGFEVVSVWGGRESADNLKHAAKAEINLVTSISGLATAKWFEKEFGTPYITAAPFGKSVARITVEALRKKEQPAVAVSEENPQVLIIGEQLMSNAIRETLNLDYGISGVQVATFFTFDKEFAQPCDRRIKGEDDLMQLVQNEDYKLIIADPDLCIFKPEMSDWIDLPHGAVCYEYTGEVLPVLAGVGLNAWLDKRIKL